MRVLSNHPVIVFKSLSCDPRTILGWLVAVMRLRHETNTLMCRITSVVAQA